MSSHLRSSFFQNEQHFKTTCEWQKRNQLSYQIIIKTTRHTLLFTWHLFYLHLLYNTGTTTPPPQWPGISSCTGVDCSVLAGSWKSLRCVEVLFSLFRWWQWEATQASRHLWFFTPVWCMSALTQHRLMSWGCAVHLIWELKL